MKKIFDSQVMAASLRKSRYGPVLESLGAELFLLQYEKGELVTSPFVEERWFQVVIQGSLSIYFIRDDGARYALSSGGQDYILGDMDLFRPDTGSICTEAAEPLLCLALSIDRNRQRLLDSAPFLQVICRSLTAKMAAITALDAAPPPCPTGCCLTCSINVRAASCGAWSAGPFTSIAVPANSSAF